MELNNTPKTMNSTIKDIVSQYREYIMKNTSFWDVLLHLTSLTLGLNIEMSYYNDINKDLARKAKYYYNSDIINVLYYKMETPITDRDYFIKTILLRGFESDQETRQLTKYYDDTKATLFISCHQLSTKNIKFTQVGINEDNEIHKYKTFAELLATIRYIIEQSIDSTVWIYIDPNTLLPTITVCEYDNKERKWLFNEFLTNFETNISIGYVGVNMYNISSENTVIAIKEQYDEFMKIINESVSYQVNETAHTLSEDKQLIRIHGDNIVVDNRFCFYYTISHKTISPLIRYIINYLNIDVNAIVNKTAKIKQNAIKTYLKYVFCDIDPYVPGQTLNKPWKCDFGVITDCKNLNDDRDKTMLLNCITSLSFNEFNSFDLVSYLYIKGFPDIVINFVLSRHPYATYEDIIGLINVHNLLYDIISYDSIFINNLEGNKQFKIWYLVFCLYPKTYKEDLWAKIESSYYVKLMLLTMGALKFSDRVNLELIVNTMLYAKREMTFEEAFKLVHPRFVLNREYNNWSMILDLLRFIGPDFTNDELRSNKNLLFKMIDKECDC